jgi:hypothetical protein
MAADGTARHKRAEKWAGIIGRNGDLPGGRVA